MLYIVLVSPSCDARNSHSFTQRRVIGTPIAPPRARKTIRRRCRCCHCYYYHRHLHYHVERTVKLLGPPSDRRRRRSRTLTNTNAGGSHAADGTAVEEISTAKTAGQPTNETYAGYFDNNGPPVLTVYMTSDNDGESVSSSGSGCPSPVPSNAGRTACAAAAASTSKGILVHNNKKSTNMNRVSFVASSSTVSSTASSSSSLSAAAAAAAAKGSGKKQHHRQLHQRRPDDDDQIPYYARTGRRLTGFGVKSHLHEFYDDPERRDSFQDDDFKYCVEPEFRWRTHCGGAYAALGFAIMTAGAVAMAVGHLIPARDPLVAGGPAEPQVIDRWAVAFNENLASCRYAGSMVLAVGVVFTVVRFWMSVIRSGGGGGGGGGEPDDRAMTKKLAGYERPSSAKQPRQTAAAVVRIPVTGLVENVQPDPRAINLQFSDSN